MIRHVVQEYDWSPTYAASIPLDQLVAWAAGKTGEISQQEAMDRIRRKKAQQDQE